MSLQDAFNPDTSPENAGPDDAGDDGIWFGLDARDYPGMKLPEDGTVHLVRDMLPLPVAGTKGFEGREETIEAALVILSQSPTGRAMMQTAIDADYTIYIDPPVIGGAGPEDEADANGGADHENRRINLRGTDDAYALALTIGHELCHVEQFVNGGLCIHIREEHPVSALKKLLAMEGDARAHEMLIAIELAYGRKDDPEGRLRFPQMIDKAVEGMGIPVVAKLMEAVAERLPDDVAHDKIMAGVFKGFYNAPGLRRHYENTILHGLERQDAKDLRDPAQFQGQISAADLMARIDAAVGRREAQTGVTPYLQKNAPGYIDLDDPAFLSVGAATQARLDRLSALRHENPAAGDEMPWRAAVYEIVKPPQEKPGKPQKPKPPGS